ncbi:MAG: shikimate dehydrogenase [Bryobacterales bacterium]|nr:shikimate dehydrogenase [Bryobacterales bacterium]
MNWAPGTVCVALGFSETRDLLEAARREADGGETFLEFRLDCLRRPEEGPRAIRAFLKEYPECAVLATCRRRPSRGRFGGDIEEQLRLLEAAVEAGARAVDLEIESAEKAGVLPETLTRGAKLVISYHDFTRTPAVEPLLRRLLRQPADTHKLVTTARKPSDIHRVLAACRAHPRDRLVAFTMGESGFPSRVLAPAFGSQYTYAAPAAGEGTAPGQVEAKTLRRQYRVDKVGRSSKIYGIIAHPVGHSISPAVHNRAFQARRLDAVYLPFLVAPAQVGDFMQLAGRLPVAGFSVTMPHKQRILRHLDHVDPLARRIGAVNTVWRKAGKWRGLNADAPAVAAPLARHLRLAKSSILLVGSGGAARAAAFALTDAGARVSIVGIELNQVRGLARACGAAMLLEEQLGKLHFDAVVHATPLGMHPRVQGCYFRDRIPADVVLDMVYNPLETLLLRRARAQGKTVIPGLQMFLEQAARQFETWTGESAPRAVMERAAREALGCAGAG